MIYISGSHRLLLKIFVCYRNKISRRIPFQDYENICLLLYVHTYIFMFPLYVRRLKFPRDYTWSVYRGSKEAKDKRNSGKWKGIFIANKTFSMVATIVATTVYNSRTCNGIAWNRSILFHSIFLLFHRDPSSVSTFQWQLWSKLDKSLRFIFFAEGYRHAQILFQLFV